jgi:hypothetical protein
MAKPRSSNITTCFVGTPRPEKWTQAVVERISKNPRTASRREPKPMQKILPQRKKGRARISVLLIDSN